MWIRIDPSRDGAFQQDFLADVERRGAVMRRASQAGYTLIEVIIAFAALALALTLLLGTLSGATKQVRWSDDAGRAAMHAQSLLAQLGVGEQLRPGHTEGDFEDGKYRWTLDVAQWKDPSLADAPPQPVDPAAPRLLSLDLLVQWGGGTPKERLQLQSLRLVTPDSLEAAPP